MNVASFLQEKKVGFKILTHSRTYDAQRLAEILRIPGRRVAKTVLLKSGRPDDYVVAVLPATKDVDLERAATALGGRRLKLASELEVAEHCSDCEIGVLPPFGSQYALPTIVDESLAEEGEIVFEGNMHDEAIHMKFDDFRQIEKPWIVDFARPKRLPAETNQVVGRPSTASRADNFGNICFHCDG